MSVEKYRLHAMPEAQCHIVIQHDTTKTVVELISYSTSVLRVVYDNNSIQLYCSGTYSTTTRRHINRFTTEFFGENMYYQCKDAVKHGVSPVVFFDQTYYTVYNIHILYTCYQDVYNTLFNTISKYENNAFGIGAVKKYRGHY